jgi:hypothetical protein
MDRSGKEAVRRGKLHSTVSWSVWRVPCHAADPQRRVYPHPCDHPHTHPRSCWRGYNEASETTTQYSPARVHWHSLGPLDHSPPSRIHISLELRLLLHTFRGYLCECVFPLLDLVTFHGVGKLYQLSQLQPGWDPPSHTHAPRCLAGGYIIPEGASCVLLLLSNTFYSTE